MLAEQRVLHGTGLPFDEYAARRLQERIHDRDRDLSAAANHRMTAMANPDFEPVGVLDQVKAPTLVIEGSHEPAKPGHSAIIAEQIPGARLMIVAGMGQTLPPEVYRSWPPPSSRTPPTETTGPRGDATKHARRVASDGHRRDHRGRRPDRSHAGR